MDSDFSEGGHSLSERNPGAMVRGIMDSRVSPQEPRDEHFGLVLVGLRLDFT